ncbi:Uncharacterized protein conserved in bacteria (DUF2218) [Mycobacteroides abscessus subsp. abscessus]|uniref:DUF2218 domain-containing protein n=1 Tax=uncultured Rothia sp. TaxID=316088 RepID=UPI00092A9582|nr:Uncharacterized protein conserved in bacteria (DUF2218) [Mycobacteroides abscessus subsp. abscessus]
MSDLPTPESLALTSRAEVATERPARYAKQLVSHMGHKVPVEEIENGHRITFNRDGNFNGYGDVLVFASERGEQLVLLAHADDDERLSRVEGILGRHLEKFGERDGLKVVFEQ